MSNKYSSGYLNLKDSPPDPKIAAAFGPRDLKTPGSFEWIVQTTSYARRIWVSLDCDTKQWLEVVAEIDREQIWKTYPPEKPYGTRAAYFKEELGTDEPELTAAKIAQQLLANGGDRKSEEFKQTLGSQGGRRQSDQSVNNRLKYGSSRIEHIRARLARDGHTDLLAKVDSGEISAHAVAVQLGWRAHMVQIPATVEGFQRAATKHLTEAERLELKEKL